MADGSFVQVERKYAKVINSLQVEVGHNEKKRMCVDARYPNAFLASSKFHLETLEKDVPEILNYLRAKESVDFTKASRLIHVDDRPLEYEHQVSLNGSELEVLTSLQSQDSRIRIERPEDGKLADGSKYLHAHQGYFKQPIAKQFRTLPADPGRTILQSNQIPYFLLHDLNKIKEERRSKLDDNVQRQKVVTEQLQAKVSLQIDGPWLWFDLRYEADKYQVRFQEVERLEPAQSFVRQKDTWIQVDKKVHSNIRGKVSKIPELQTLSDRFRTRAYHFDQVESLLREIATIDMSEADFFDPTCWHGLAWQKVTGC